MQFRVMALGAKQTKVHSLPDTPRHAQTRSVNDLGSASDLTARPLAHPWTLHRRILHLHPESVLNM